MINGNYDLPHNNNRNLNRDYIYSNLWYSKLYKINIKMSASNTLWQQTREEEELNQLNIENYEHLSN